MPAAIIIYYGFYLLGNVPRTVGSPLGVAILTHVLLQFVTMRDKIPSHTRPQITAVFSDYSIGILRLYFSDVFLSPVGT